MFGTLTMANPEQLDIIVHEGAGSWNRLRKRKRLEGMPDLSNANLSNLKLHQINLHEANLENANFEHTILSDSKLGRAYCRNAHFAGASLTRADLRDANLQGADLQYSNLEWSRLSRANLQGANLREASLREAYLDEARLCLADLTKANMQVANLSAADLRETCLRQTRLASANLQGAILTGADLRGAELINANLTDVDLASVNLEGAILLGATIDHRSTDFLPDSIKATYGLSFLVRGLPEIETQSITRSIEFPPEYHQSGVSILNYFGTILRQKYPEKRVKVRIEQEGLRVTLIVETEEGDREAVQRTLDEFGLVVLNEIPASQLLPDPLHAMALENRLEIAKLEIRQAYKMLDFSKNHYEKRIAALEEDNRWFRQHVGGLLVHSGELVESSRETARVFGGITKQALSKDQAFLISMAEQSGIIRKELSTLANKLGTLNKTKEDIGEVKSILLSIREKEPGKYERIKDYFYDLATGATASIYATVIFEALKLL